MSCNQRIDQSATSIQSLLNTKGVSFLMKSHVRSALWTLTPSASRSKSKWYKAQKIQKCALKPQLKASQILTNDDEVEN